MCAMNSRRRYSMGLREQGMSENRSRVQETVLRLVGERRLADVTLGEIATRSGVSVRTLLRYYGSRDLLLKSVADELHELPLATRPSDPEDVGGALAALATEYETLGPLMLMLLS